jgi:hypothetical protein
MIASLVLMPTAILMAVRGVRASLKVATTGTATTAAGFIFGAILLLDSPVLSECIVLTSYLVSVIVIYAVGFGWGIETKARLLRVEA